MKDKNKFTFKIVLVIALAVALIATLISCCVLATKGKLSTQASCDNNQTAFAYERPDLDCYATASVSETDYIPISQAVLRTVKYYGIYIPDNERYNSLSFETKTLFGFRSADDADILKYYAKSLTDNFGYKRITLYSIDMSLIEYFYILCVGNFNNEFMLNVGFYFQDIFIENCAPYDIYVRVTPYDGNSSIHDLQEKVNTLTAEKLSLQNQVSEKQNQIDTLTAEKAALQTQVNDLTADKTALQAQITEKQNQIDTLTAEKSALQTQVTEKQNQIDSLTIQKNALQKQVNDLTAKNTDLQNRLDKFLQDAYFCKFETVVGDYYVSETYYNWGYDENHVTTEYPFGNGQKGKIQNTLYIDRQVIVPHYPYNDKDKIISFHNTFYLYKNQNEYDIPVALTGLIDFVEYSVKNYNASTGYPILMTNSYGTPRCIAFRLVDYNADAMKDVVISDRTYKTGYDKGRANGISEATQNGHIFESSTSFLKSIFTDLGQLLDIKVFGNITVGTLIGIPLILLVVMAVLKLVRG